MSTRRDFTYAAYLDEKSSNAGYDSYVKWLHLEYGKRIDDLQARDQVKNCTGREVAANEPDLLGPCPLCDAPGKCGCLQ